MSRLIDLSGQRFGKLTVIERAESSKQPSGQTKTKWRCRCDCGTEIVVLGYCLKSGNTQSCGCLNDEKRHERTFIDLTGQKFNKLTVMERAEDHEQPSGQRKTMWRCRCDCGNETIVTAYDLYHGHTKSCGCSYYDYIQMLRSAIKPNEKKHRQSHSLRKTYDGMLYRCNNINASNYSRYGGRGIKVCEEWSNNFESFKEWALQNGYELGLSIDRIDVNGDYTPDNCRWVTMKKQANNKRTTRWVEYNGERMSVSEFAQVIGLNYSTAYFRISRGWPIERIINQPLRCLENGHIHYGQLNGEINSWGEKYCS